jgi:hypothetical protein
MPRVRLDFMVEPRYTVKALDQSTWTAFAVLVERNNGIFGGCWCLGFHPKESWTDVAQKRAAKESERQSPRRARFRRGGLRRLVPVRRARRSAPDQEPGGVRERPDDLARLANRVLLCR